MDRNGLGRFALIAACTALIAMFWVAPASAQIFGRIHPPCEYGEPTDPDGAYLLAQSVDVDPTEYGLNATVPQEEAEAQSWFEGLLALLRSLGVLPAEDGG